MANRNGPDRIARYRGTIAASLAALALTNGLGCGREFFRKWADQDVTESVFEKSRDPRWNLPVFSIEPPATSRFNDWSDPDRPAAPPDDYVAQELAPVPQKPHIRLMTPMEGTGYLDVLGQVPHYEPPADQVGPVSIDEAEEVDVAVPPASGEPGPFGTEPDPVLPPAVPDEDAELDAPNSDNLGPVPGELSPIEGEAAPSAIPPAGAEVPQSYRPKRDSGLLAVAYQEPAAPPTSPTDEPGPVTASDDQLDSLKQDKPDRRINLNNPPITQPNLTPDEVQEVERARSGFAAAISSGYLDVNQATSAGLPSESRPPVVSPAVALQLGLVNSRTYQSSLEDIYLSSLNVTLQRFAFEPQVTAGLQPGTFNYRTREAPGGQQSILNLNTAAGISKLFVFGGQLATSFANTTVFNFLGNNPSQPTVQSSLPLTFVQPFLRGGGRAVTLEPLTLGERNLLYTVRNFARFRQSFFVALLTSGGGAAGGGVGGGDPTVGFLQVLQNYQLAENTRRSVAAYERAKAIYEIYAGGANSGISQLQVVQLGTQLESQRLQLITNETQYRNSLDQYKQQLGMPPDTPMILDTTLLDGFRSVFRTIIDWEQREDHDPEELDDILGGLPSLQNLTLDGRSLWDLSGETPEALFADPERQEEFLLTGERIALENRLDLMNQRGQLYDAWRQIAVASNALLPVFTVNYNGQLITPPTTTNPFGFTSQSLQHQLSLTAQLPLIRLNERNNFRTQLINYQRQRRALMQFEDQTKFTIRNEIRGLIQSFESYQITKLQLLLTLLTRDQTLQQIVAPPEAGAVANQAAQTTNFIFSIQNILGSQNSLVQNWVAYQSTRLALYRDLGIMPYDEWEAFYELFPSEAGRIGDGVGPNGSAGGGALGGPGSGPGPDGDAGLIGP